MKRIRRPELTLAISLLAAALLVPALHADVRLPAIFSDHLVFQRDASVAVWGWAEPGEEVAVEFAGQKKTAKADAKGKWMVKLDPMPASTEARTLTVRSQATNHELRVTDILVGEVWLGSGQSNMAMTVQSSNNFEQEKAAANFPQVRMFTVDRNPQRTPQSDCKGSWKLTTPENVGPFSAAAYFFGRELHQKLGVPVGLINSSYGGTDIAAWTSEDVQMKVPELKAAFENWARNDAAYVPEKAMAVYEKQLAAWKEKTKKARAAGEKPPRAPQKPVQPRLSQNHPANLYNGMIAPILPYGIRGAIWYQGEHNANPVGGLLYAKQLPLLIKDWRTRWGYEFPFAWAQLPNFNRPGDGWMLVRESMLKSLSVPKTGMAIIIDIGDPQDIHPKNKQDVGKRLALWALGTVYGEKVSAVSGPLPAGHKIRGSEIVLSFTHTNGGLVAKGGALKCFVIAGADKQWKPATARIEGDKVIVSSPDVPKPVAARYAWLDNPDCNLFNGAGLPASPFRTDHWPVEEQPAQPKRK
ncbi:MAG: sialate O-acetylesterase [Verrucomicrobia bacterium]|nr:sialate O-acetylesterase [Verrucomicrobiota bacterium]